MEISSLAQVKELLDKWKHPKPGQQVIIGFSQVRESVQVLKDSTDSGGEIDPFEKIEGLLFYDFSTYFHHIGFYDMGIYSMTAFYKRCLELQEKYKRRINKELILHWLGRYHHQIRDYEIALKYYLLSFIEEIITKFTKDGAINDDLIGSSSKDILLLFFNIPEYILKRIQKETLNILSKHVASYLYPEEIFTELQSFKKIYIPRFTDYKFYNPPLSYLKELFNSIKQSEDRKLWEKFAAVLFSSIEGFEPLSDIWVGNRSYQFDLVIRNMVNIGAFFIMLGDYIPVECKYFGKDSINVKNLNHFAYKLKYHNFKCGIILSKTKISGWRKKQKKGREKGRKKGDDRFGRLLQIKLFNRDNIIIFDIDFKDIESILRGKNLIDLLIKKYEEIRLES